MIEPLDFESIRQTYEKTPRALDSRLRPLTRLDVGERPAFPTVRLAVVLLVLSAGAYGAAIAFAVEPALAFFIALPLMLGAGIQIVRTASPAVKTARLLETAPLVLGGVVRAHNKLYRPGDEAEEAVVVFSLDGARRFDRLYLRDLVRKVRSAIEAPAPPADIAPAVVRTQEPGAPVRLPERVAGEGEAWLARVLVVPDRLPDNKIGDHTVPLLVAPEQGLAVHV